MMANPEKKSETEQDFEWGYVDGKMTKITKENSNGRICECCNHPCPCKGCKCCKTICCTDYKKSNGKCP